MVNARVEKTNSAKKFINTARRSFPTEHMLNALVLTFVNKDTDIPEDRNCGHICKAMPKENETTKCEFLFLTKCAESLHSWNVLISTDYLWKMRVI